MTDTVEGVPVSPEVPKAATDDLMSALNQQADQARRYYEKLAKQIKQVAADTATLSTTGTGETKMAEVMTPSMIMGGGSGDGLFGGAGAGGLIGGLILGSLLRNGRGGVFGDDGAGVVGGAVLRNPPEQNQANMDLMAGIGQVDKAVAVSTAAMEASQAQQSASIVGQLNNVASSLATRVDSTKETVNAMAMVLAQQLNGLEKTTMENRYALSQDIAADGDKTRALITQQYEMNLQRQLADANAAIIELRGDNRLAERTRGIEVTTTNNINQAQAQQQQQAQFGQLANLIWSLGQSIRDTNSAINVGSGTQTSTNTPTNTNIR